MKRKRILYMTQWRKFIISTVRKKVSYLQSWKFVTKSFQGSWLYMRQHIITSLTAEIWALCLQSTIVNEVSTSHTEQTIQHIFGMTKECHLDNCQLTHSLNKSFIARKVPPWMWFRPQLLMFLIMTIKNNGCWLYYVVLLYSSIFWLFNLAVWSTF